MNYKLFFNKTSSIVGLLESMYRMYSDTEEITDHRLVKQSNSTDAIFHCSESHVRETRVCQSTHQKF